MLDNNEEQGESTIDNPPSESIKNDVLDNSETEGKYPDTSDDLQEKSDSNTSDTTNNKKQKF
jgi:hypothetical protein